jgi:hypothetical protein
MNADKIRELVGSGKTVIVMLTNAKVVSAKRDVIRLKSGYLTGVTKYVVTDENLGTIWFSTSSNKLSGVSVGDTITCKATLTGMGKPTPRFPNPMLFAKINTRQKELVVRTVESFNEGEHSTSAPLL